MLHDSWNISSACNWIRDYLNSLLRVLVLMTVFVCVRVSVFGWQLLLSAGWYRNSFWFVAIVWPLYRTNESNERDMSYLHKYDGIGIGFDADALAIIATE